MKAFSIQQPWGTLIVSGLKDVENRKWALKTLPLRVLIHAGARRQPITDKNMPYPFYWHIENYQKMGLLPPLEKTPVSAIIGVATITACETNSQSLWAARGPGAEYQWVMTDVQMFKKPILNVKGKLGIFDIPEIDENNLPECVNIPKPHREGTTLYLPLNNKLYNQIQDGELNSLSWNVVDDNLHLFTDNDLNPLPTNKLVVCNNGQTLELDLGRYTVQPVIDDNGQVWTETDYLDREYGWLEAYMEFE